MTNESKEKRREVERGIGARDVDKVKQLLTADPVLMKTPDFETPWLVEAADVRDLPMVRLLLELGANINDGKYTALDHAIWNNDIVIAEFLLQHGADPNHQREIISAVNHSLDMVKLLERYGANIHRVFVNGAGEPMNALSHAIEWGKDDVADYLRSRGAVIPTELPPPEPPTLRETMIAAVRSGDVERVRQLFTEHPRELERKLDPDGTTWLHLAVRSGHIPMIELLMSLGCDVNAPVEDASRLATPVQEAESSPSLLHWLLEHGARAGAPLWGTGTPHTLEILRLLDRYGGDLHATHLNGVGEVSNVLKEAIHWGKHFGYAPNNDVIEFLRFKGVRLPNEKAAPPYEGVMRQPDDLEWAIVDAVRAGDVDKVRRLLTENPGYIHRPHYGHSWLQIAAHYDSVPMMKLLIELGIDVNAEGVNHSVALDAAVMNATPETVRLLLEQGADPNRGTQVLWATRGGKESLEILQLLEQYGADLFRRFVNEAAEDKRPICAFDVAKDCEQKEVMKYLQMRKKGGVAPPAPEQSLDDDIIAYFTQNFGPVQRVALIEIVPSDPPITVHAIPASKDRNHITLFTTGMSAQPMTVPEGEQDYQYAELFVQLPADWQYRKIEDPNYGWPIHWLRSTAKYPFQNDTWLGGPVTIIANDDPPEPLAPNTRLTSLLFLAEKSFVSSAGQKIQLYRMVPLYTEERDLEMREGIAALLRALDSHNVSSVVDLKRPSVA